MNLNENGFNYNDVDINESTSAITFVFGDFSMRGYLKIFNFKI
jgi:hypothetical protein